MCQRVDSLAQWLEHWSFTGATRVRFPAKAREIFQLCFTLLRISCRKMGAQVRDWTFIRLKRLLHKVDFAYHLVYNQSLATASESRLFGSVVRALVFYQGDSSSIPSEGTGNFSAMLYFVTAIMS